jgi:hypothetical protein
VNIINTPIKVSEEPGGKRLVEIHQPLSKNIGDDPQTLPILNAEMYRFKTSPDTDDAVMAAQWRRARACQLTLPVIRMFPSRRCKSAKKNALHMQGVFLQWQV